MGHLRGVAGRRAEARGCEPAPRGDISLSHCILRQCNDSTGFPSAGAGTEETDKLAQVAPVLAEVGEAGAAPAATPERRAERNGFEGQADVVGEAEDSGPVGEG